MTSRGWTVSSAAQSRNDERKPCATAAILWYWSILGSVDMPIGLPLRIGNTSRLPIPSVRAASRISSARPHSGNRCSRFAFHPCGAGRPHRDGRVDLVPRRQPDRAGPRRCQHQELGRELDGRLRRARRPHRLDGRGNVLVGQRQPVRHDVVLRTQDRQDPIAGVVATQVHRYGPLQHRADALTHGAGRLRLRVPDRREDLQHVGRVDLGDWPGADAGEGVTLQAANPVLRVPPAAPAVALLFKHALRGLGEAGNALRAPLVGQRVTAQPCQYPIGERQLAGLGERDERGGAETEFAPSSADDEPLDPASGAGWLDEEVQPVPVCVPSWWGGTDEGGRQRLVGMASSALGSRGCGGGFGYNISSPIICGNGPDFTLRPDRLNSRVRVINYYSSTVYVATRTDLDSSGNPLITQAGRTRRGCSPGSDAAPGSAATGLPTCRRRRCSPRRTAGRRRRT